MNQKVVLASNNAGKLKEFFEILAPLGIELYPQSTFHIPDAEEPYPSFLENALTKARHASKLSGLPALADDSGLCINALGGAPGVLSARFAGEPKSDLRNNQRLIQELSAHSDRSAFYYCVLVFVLSENDPRPVIADGILRGEIIEKGRGTGGFGYDPHFFLPELNKTVAEISAEEKNNISHRGKALRSLLEKLR
ncbi:MAG: RdgB/HAM1 family non-canonical purine NTP pyrophosphatase [Burkholderiaceae bacterium]|nr:RdgB/HAM1 family non-canonical purine NTP pyrophosphatase [Burkholderiaceae bacterium]